MSYSINFGKAFTMLIGHEGGYVNDPDDPGGETKYGIAKRYHPNIVIENLTLEGAKIIYHKEYWAVAGCDALPWNVAYPLFDAAVNMSPKRALMLLQQSLGEVPDGLLGPRTKAAINDQKSDPDLLARFMTERALYYISRGHFWKFGKGWMRRLFRVTAQTLTKGDIDV